MGVEIEDVRTRQTEGIALDVNAGSTSPEEAAKKENCASIDNKRKGYRGRSIFVVPIAKTDSLSSPFSRAATARHRSLDLPLASFLFLYLLFHILPGGCKAWSKELGRVICR